MADLFGAPSVALIMVVLALRSVGMAFQIPSLGAVVPMIVPKDKLLKYSGSSQVLQFVSLLISPSLEAILFTACDLRFIIMLNVVGTIIVIMCIFIVKIPKIPKSEFPKIKNFKKELIEGFGIIKKHHLTNFVLQFLVDFFLEWHFYTMPYLKNKIIIPHIFSIEQVIKYHV